VASIATSAQKQEKLAQVFTRNQFSICAEVMFEAEGVPDSVISLRGYAKKLSLGGGQGYQTDVCVEVNASQISASVKATGSFVILNVMVASKNSSSSHVNKGYNLNE
jgi:hypothetical protein